MSKYAAYCCLSLVLVGSPWFMGGCESSKKNPAAHHRAVPDDSEVNRLITELIFEDSRRNAVIRERTVYDYHFHPGTAELNDLGMHHLSILADYYREYPGELTFPAQGSAGDRANDLYNRRKARLMSYFVDAGFEAGRVAINDGFPKGDGLSADASLRAYSDEGGSNEGGDEAPSALMTLPGN